MRELVVEKRSVIDLHARFSYELPKGPASSSRCTSPFIRFASTWRLSASQTTLVSAKILMESSGELSLMIKSPSSVKRYTLAAARDHQTFKARL